MQVFVDLAKSSGHVTLYLSYCESCVARYLNIGQVAEANRDEHVSRTPRYRRHCGFELPECL